MFITDCDAPHNGCGVEVAGMGEAAEVSSGIVVSVDKGWVGLGRLRVGPSG